MKKSILNLGTVLKRKELQTINGSGPFGCNECPSECLNCVEDGFQSCGTGTSVACHDGSEAGFNICYICDRGGVL
jgi:hypothetical protein